jgi:hypothetical protein
MHLVWRGIAPRTTPPPWPASPWVRDARLSAA